jgi:hypothetical protein
VNWNRAARGADHGVEFPAEIEKRREAARQEAETLRTKLENAQLKKLKPTPAPKIAAAETRAAEAEAATTHPAPLRSGARRDGVRGAMRRLQYRAPAAAHVDLRRSRELPEGVDTLMFDHLLVPLIAAFYRPRGFSGIPGSACNPKPDYGMNTGPGIDEPRGSCSTATRSPKRRSTTRTAKRGATPSRTGVVRSGAGSEADRDHPRFARGRYV